MTIAQRVYVTTILLFKVNHVPKLLLQSFTHTQNVRVQLHIMYDEDIKTEESHQRALTMNWPNFFKVQFMSTLTTDKRKQVNSILEFN